MSRGQSGMGEKNRVTDAVWSGGVLEESYGQRVC